LQELSQRIAQCPHEFHLQMKVYDFLYYASALFQLQCCSQLAKETWFDLLAFVPRRQLGQIVSRIGRQFARIVQPFLYNYGHITLGNILISSPRESDLARRPTFQVAQSFAQWYAEPWGTLSRQLVWPADVSMPENIKDFISLEIRFTSIFRH
jgi:hypothetical protein